MPGAGDTGNHLAAALATNAGGFLLRLFFLSACHSGDIPLVADLLADRAFALLAHWLR